MRMLNLTFLGFTLATVIGITSAFGIDDVYVRGHWRDTNRDGIKDTYIMPHYRTKPDGNPFNNYSTKGNFNPWTGEWGTKNPYKSKGWDW